MEQTRFSPFGALLQRLRTRRYLSQEALARAAGVHRNTISTWERGDGLPQTKGLVLELARQLQLDDAETRELLEASLTGLAPYWAVPFPRNPFFTGREALLEELHTLLSAEQPLALTQSYALSGLGGIGKTHLALEYAYRYALSYRAVFWLAVDTRESLLASCSTIAEVLQLPERQEAHQEQLVAAVRRWLATHSQWLLIWDNVEDLALLEEVLPPARAGAHLFTTRRTTLSTLAHLVEVPPLTDEEGQVLLLRRAKRLSPMQGGTLVSQLAERWPSEVAAAAALVDLLHRLPLALDQAGAYVEETAGRLADYLQLYQTRRAELLNRRGSAVSAHPASVVTTWSVAFERLEQTHPAAADLLRVCALLYPEGIPEELFTHGAEHLGKRLGPVAADPLQWQEALGAVFAYSLLRRNSEDHTLSIHRLVQAVLRDGLEATTARQWQKRVVRALHAVFPEPEAARWPQCERLVPHALGCRQWLDQVEGSWLEAAVLLRKVGSYLRERGRYGEAEPVLVQALALQEQHLGAEHLEVASTMEGLANLYARLGQYQRAELLLQRTLALREAQLGPNHPDVAASLNNLAVIYADWGQAGHNEEAERLYGRALAIRERTLGPTHPQTAESLYNLGLFAWGKGRYHQAQPLLQRSVSIYEQQLGSTHPETARSLRVLGSLYREQGKYAQAEPLYLQALATYEQRLGSEHPSTALTLGSLGILYREQGKYDQAEPLLRRALSICEEQLGPNHPRTAEVLDHLASLYRDQGNYEQAEPLFRRTVALREHLIGPNHFDVALSLKRLGTLYREQGKYDQAEPLLQRALSICEEQLGPDHPYTARCLRHLGLLYRAQGKYAQAEPVLHRALAIHEHTLGREHPDTARCLEALARLAEAQCHPVEAEALYRRALAIYEQALGDAHPNTLATRARSTQLLQEQACAEDAATVERRAEGSPEPGRAERQKERAALQLPEAVAPVPSENDPLHGFLAGWCELHPRAWSRANDLWQAYERWAAEHQERFPLSRRAFIAQLKAHGCRADRTKAARIWRGIALRTQDRDSR